MVLRRASTGDEGGSQFDIEIIANEEDYWGKLIRIREWYINTKGEKVVQEIVLSADYVKFAAAFVEAFYPKE